jgi:uncharacterized membrane protein YfcA
MSEWIVTDMLVSLLIAVLSGMGIGSGGLLVLYLSAVRDTPQLTAQGLNLLFFIFASAASLCIHLSRRHISFWLVLLLTLGGLVGSLLGGRLATALPEDWMRRLFGLFLIGAGALTLLRRDSQRQPSDRASQQ